MIIVMKPNAKEEYINNITDRLIEAGLGTNKIVGVDCTVIGIVGDTSKVDRELMATLPGVARVLKVQEPFKRANRAFKKEDTVVDVSGVKIGAGKPVIIAGPCSVESEEQVINIAKSVKAAGASILRGGAFKPRTSPYAFQGLALDGLKILKLAKEEVGIPIVSEIVSIRHLEYSYAKVDKSMVFTVQDMSNWAIIVPVLKNGDMVIVNQFRAGTDSDTLEFPGGAINKQEEPVKAAERELEEETGLKAEKIIPIGVMDPNPAFMTNKCFAFAALGCSFTGSTSLDMFEDAKAQVISEKDLQNKIKNGEFSQSLSIAAYLLYKNNL